MSRQRTALLILAAVVPLGFVALGAYEWFRWHRRLNPTFPWAT